jgi:chemotaxis protein MotB
MPMEQPKAAAQAQRPIIIVKKKGGQEGHHGGAWKVAYADFVTALMALFIVLWLVNGSQEVQKGVGGYFMDPLGKGKEAGTGMNGSGETVSIRPDDMPKIKEQIEREMKKLPQIQAVKDQVQIIVTGEGLRIELLEDEAGTFFESGRAEPTGKCREMLGMLATQLGTLPNRLLIEGHTDAAPFNSDKNYTNWELSADRANAARRLMESGGLRKNQVVQVRGFADQNLRMPNDPGNASNRRVSVIVQYTEGSPPPIPTKAGATGHQAAGPAPASPPSHSK